MTEQSDFHKSSILNLQFRFVRVGYLYIISGIPFVLGNGNQKSTLMAYLELENLYKYYGNVKAVDGVNLSVERGEFLTLLGPSGSGKTTLLMMVAGFVILTRDELFGLGHDRPQG
jgi:ABC-type glutathione transport system ATPase component